MSWLNFGNTANGESVMEQKVVVAPTQQQERVVHIKTIESHPSAQINASKPFEISKIENGVTSNRNVQKQPDTITLKLCYCRRQNITRNQNFDIIKLLLLFLICKHNVFFKEQHLKSLSRDTQLGLQKIHTL